MPILMVRLDWSLAMTTELLNRSTVAHDTSVIDGLFNRYRETAGPDASYDIRLDAGCTPAAYIAVDSDVSVHADDKKSVKRAIFQDAKDVLLRLGCSTLGVKLLPKVLFSIVRPKASDKVSNKQTLASMLSISSARFSNEVSEFESAAESKAVKAWIELLDSNATDKEFDSLEESTRAVISELRKLRGWSNNFEANMATLNRAAAVVATSGGDITDLEGVTFTLPQWSFRMMTNKAISVQSIRLADHGYARAHKAAHSKAKKS